MANILIHGLNSKSGGGKSILNNYLSLLRKSSTEDTYYVLSPCKLEYEKYSSNNIKIVDIPDIYKKLYMVYFRYEFILPKLVRALGIDIIFNLSDVPIKSKGVKQLFLFDWSYAIYPESIVWKKMDFISYVERKIKVFFFEKYIDFISVILPQTKTAEKRLIDMYDFSCSKIVPNAVSIDNMGGGEFNEFNLPSGINLLYLSVYFPHKNMEVFLPLAREIRKQKLNYKIIVTIDKTQHRKVKDFLNAIKKEKLSDIIINIGPVEMKHVPSLYKQCDALLMPTLLESFSGTYVEAMFHGIPIFTSDLDFARDVCKDSAFYFDPLDSESILTALDKGFNTQGLIDEKINKGHELLKDFSDWDSVLKKLTMIVEEQK